MPLRARRFGVFLAVSLRSRFRPIVLTAVTTFAGLAPLLTERSVGAQFQLPMASSLAFGVLVATAISLFLVPSLYLILEDFQRMLGRGDARSAPPLRPVRPALEAERPASP